MDEHPGGADYDEGFNDLSWRAWLGLAWRGFNRWRRKHWLTRVIVLLLIFSPWFAGMLNPRGLLITRLVRIAIEAIQVSSEPSLAHNLTRYYRLEEAERLRLSLWHELDGNHDGVLDAAEGIRTEATGLDPAQLTCPVTQADPEQLAAAAKRLAVVPPSYSLTEVYKRTWFAAQAETERLMAPSHQRIEALLRTHEERLNYLEWETWERGVYLFIERLIQVLGPPRQALVCFLSYFLVGGIGSLTVSRHRPAAGLCCGLLIAAIALLVRWGLPFLSPSWDWLYWAGYALLACAVGYAGGKAASHVTHRAMAALGGIVLLGLVLVGYGATYGLALRAVYWWYGFDFGVYGVRSPWFLYGPAFAGLALMAGGVLGMYLLCRRRRVRPS
jgi:hypothetical protein